MPRARGWRPSPARSRAARARAARRDRSTRGDVTGRGLRAARAALGDAVGLGVLGRRLYQLGELLEQVAERLHLGAAETTGPAGLGGVGDAACLGRPLLALLA